VRAPRDGAGAELAFLAAMVDDDGDTLLQMAATHGRTDVLRYLVEELRLDVNQPNSIGSIHSPSGSILHLLGF
jgi:ankyrin repeat protein